MYEAVQPTETDNTSSARSFQRPFKPLRTSVLENNNLAVFRRLRDKKKTGVPLAVCGVEETGRTANPATLFVRKVHKSAKGNSSNKAIIGDHSVVAGNKIASGRIHGRQLVGVTVVAVVIGAVVANIWTTGEQREQQGNTVPGNVSPETAIHQNSSEKMTQAPEHTLPYISPPTVSDLYYIEFELNNTSQLTMEYAEEIRQLRALNTSLRNEVDFLGDETTDLNNNLLKLESTLSKLEFPSDIAVDMRTVYKIVDVPLGSDPEKDSVEPSGNSVTDIDSRADNIDAQAPEELIVWDSDEELVE